MENLINTLRLSPTTPDKVMVGSTGADSKSHDGPPQPLAYQGSGH